MPRLPIPSDTSEFDEETRAAVRHIQQTRKSMPPPSSYLTYAGKAGALLSEPVSKVLEPYESPVILSMAADSGKAGGCHVDGRTAQGAQAASWTLSE